MRIARVLLAGAAAALLAACSTPQAVPPADSTPAPGATSAAAEGAYPGPAAEGAYPGPGAEGAYPGPAGQPAPDPAVSMEPIVVPAPASAEVGVVHGVLFRTTPDGQRLPVSGYFVYLATTVNSNDGVEGMVKLDITTAPRAELNGLGQFVFSDVPQGRYGLMLDSGPRGGALLLNDPVTAGDLIIEIKGGDTQDLGELAYPLPEL